MADKVRTAAEIEDALRRAKAALDAGRAIEAEQLARAVLKRDVRHSNAQQILGGALLLQGRFEDAIAPLKAAARVFRDPALDTQLAIALREAGHIEEALSRLNRAIKREQPYAFAYHELGFLLHAMGNDDEAVAAIERGIRMVPLSTNLFVLLGGIQHARRDLRRAKAAYAHALAIAPQLATAHYGLGAVLMTEAAFKEAIEHFRFAAMNDPADLQPRLKLAACVLETGDTAAALSLFRDAVRVDPQIYPLSLKLILSAGRGKFWLRPSDATRALT
jgi:tetratricopeptide (TPR) repeat protein